MDEFQLVNIYNILFMRKILCLMLIPLFIGGCEKDNDFFLENPVTERNIKLVRLRADHNTLLPDGKATMKFYAEAYNILELPDYTPTYEEDSAIYIPGIVRDTSLIPADLLPTGLFRLLDDSGNEYSDFSFSTTDTQERMIRFHVEAGELTSEEVEIRVRSLPQEKYEEIEIPLIFHVLNPAKNPSIAPIDVTPETVEKNVMRLNDVFNGKATTDPNGGNARITFRLAEYDNNGIKLEYPGVHYYELSSSDVLKESDDYENYVMSKGNTLMYDYRNYLNIWLINEPRVSSFIVRGPTVIDWPEKPIPGLNAKALPETFPERPTDIGFFVNMSYFVNPLQSADYFEISTVMAQYLGLLTTRGVEAYGETNFVNGDTDYCSDTPYYWNEFSSVFKNNSKGNSTDENTLYFTSYNVMDSYSYKNSITVDQVARIRLHLERCPSRWMYKSKFAFTGKLEDLK